METLKSYLFRGLTLDNEWVYGYPAFYGDGYFLTTGELHNNEGKGWRVKAYEVHPKSIGRNTTIKDMDGRIIYFGDIVEFTDKREWYRGQYGIKMTFADPKKRAKLKKAYEAEPMERRVVDLITDYDWLLSSEIQTYWRVIGNDFQNENLLTQ